MSTDIHQLGRENSQRAVIGGKGLVQLGHLPADAGQAFHHKSLKPHFRKIQRGLNPRNAASDDKDVSTHNKLSLLLYHPVKPEKLKVPKVRIA
jgi:hypothetical protein